VTAVDDLEAGLVPVATILATVELERALAAMGRPQGAPARRSRIPTSGPAVAILDGDDGRRIALAEPSTEGRLAATLARHDEGAVGSYVTTREDEPDGLDGFPAPGRGRLVSRSAGWRSGRSARRSSFSPGRQPDRT
jgi:hypothetical protein